MPVIGPQTHVERVSEARIWVGCRELANGAHAAGSNPMKVTSEDQPHETRPRVPTP